MRLLEKMAKLKITGVSEEEFYRFENPDDENDLVSFIRKHLLSETQRRELFEHNLSVEDCLNGRYTAEHSAFVHSLYADWNDKLGYQSFAR